jgi:hypothetical protein
MTEIASEGNLVLESCSYSVVGADGRAAFNGRGGCNDVDGLFESFEDGVTFRRCSAFRRSDIDSLLLSAWLDPVPTLWLETC